MPRASAGVVTTSVRMCCLSIVSLECGAQIREGGWLICYNIFNERKHAKLLEMVVADFLGGAEFGCSSVGDRAMACSKVCSRCGCRGDFADDTDRDHALASVDGLNGAGVEMADDLYRQG